MNNNITPLVDDLRQIINEARNRVAVNVNAELTLMYWHIGERINREVLGNERAEYGKQIVAAVSRQLQNEFGAKGFEERNIRRMMDFANLFSDLQIVSTLSTQLSWSHFVEILAYGIRHALSPQVKTKWYPVGHKACLMPTGCDIWDIPVGQKACLLPLVKKNYNPHGKYDFGDGLILRPVGDRACHIPTG